MTIAAASGKCEHPALMYAALDEIDLRARTATGEELFVQTDARTAEEVDADPDLSLVFAAVRALNPGRAGQIGRFVVRYESSHVPPAFLRCVIASAGARHTVAGATLPFEGELVDVDDAVDRALARLAADVAGGAPSLGSLAALEGTCASAPPSRETHPAAYWRAVVVLGALTGELLRAAPGGRWARGKQSTLPFVFATTRSGAPARLNPFGMAIKRLADGTGESLGAMVSRARAAP